MEKNLPSKKQRELLSFIDGFIKGNGYGPSYREIMRALDYKSVSTVAVHVDGLIAKGYLYKRDNSARSLEITTPTVSGKTVEKPTDDVHEKWLVDQLTVRFKDLSTQPTDQKRGEAQTLVDALKVLGMAAAHIDAQKQLAKHLDQSIQ
jgi:SOS-response transcriptional repressor LexA